MRVSQRVLIWLKVLDSYTGGFAPVYLNQENLHPPEHSAIVPLSHGGTAILKQPPRGFSLIHQRNFL
ncbi:hypothetical protein CJA_0933 [Cellvibrio japonicus Ueda107]|uniref:Uncharacterized protein n=1 Tax=Cellvibrio japonicus (strain Ueda107) TaxID=498211 RepID=B3PLA9_CELJU|nr:hypothetical protein CJA_0933 [Cellvibrio japonicus Ueda107]